MSCFHATTSVNNKIGTGYNFDLFEGVERKQATTYFIGSKFQNDMPLKVDKKNIKNGIVKNKEITISCYQNKEKLREKFNFKDNGFQFCALSDELTASVEQFGSHRFEENYYSEISALATQFITGWGEKNNIEFSAVIPLGFNYRDQDIRNPNDMKPFLITHVDFEKSSIAQTLMSVEKTWKPQFEAVLGEKSHQEYLSLPITQIVNLWMPLNKRPTKNGLAMMDTSSIGSEKSLRPFTSVPANGSAPFKSLSLRHDKKQVWIAQKSMTLGNGVIFNSFKTPHSAVELAEDLGVQYDKYRKSVEGRFAFIKY